MALKRYRLLAALGLGLGLPALALAQPAVVSRPIAVAQATTVVARSAPKALPVPVVSPVASLSPSRPAVQLGRPIAVAGTAIRQVSAQRVVRGQSPEPLAPLVYPPSIPDPLQGNFYSGIPSESGTTIPLSGDPARSEPFPSMPTPPMPTPPEPAPPMPTPPMPTPPEPASPLPTPPLPTPPGRDAVLTTVADEPGTAPPQPAIPPLTPHFTSNPPGDVPPPSASPFGPGPDVAPGVALDRPVAPTFWEKCKGWVSWGDRGSANGRCSFQSDHCFERMVSPVTMPFYFEDPRALTEIRPIFMYQSIPKDLNSFGGGDAWFFGTQFRVAVTDRLSFVWSELGALSINPSDPVPPVQSGTGFAELKFGPKYTFYRNTNSGTVAAGGINFEVPVGSSTVFQDVGTLSIDPYVTFGQTFGQILPGGWGSFNVLANLGYSVSVDNKRSDFVYSSLHVDYNVANTNTFFPLIEMNWMHYTNAGTSNNLGTEGADLINFGSSTRKGTNYMSLAAGMRYRFNEHIIAGGAFEVPLTSEKGLADYRVTFDVIFRY